MGVELTRRSALTVGLGGAALLGLGGALRWLRGGYALPQGDVALALSEKEMVVVRAIVESLLPGDETLPAGLEIGVHQRIDEEVWAAPPAVSKDLKAALQLLEHSPPGVGAWGRLSALSPDKRAATFEKFLTAKVDVVAQAATVFRQLSFLFYFGHPRVWPALGYDGPWVKTEKPPASSLRYQALLEQARAETAS